MEVVLPIEALHSMFTCTMSAYNHVLVLRVEDCTCSVECLHDFFGFLGLEDHAVIRESRLEGFWAVIPHDSSGKGCRKELARPLTLEHVED